MADHDMNAPPSGAKDAVLVQSEDMPKDAPRVEDFDFNRFKDRPMTAEDLLLGMQNMGFQASSIGEAVRIINGMVSPCFYAGLKPREEKHPSK